MSQSRSEEQLKRLVRQTSLYKYTSISTKRYRPSPPPNCRVLQHLRLRKEFTEADKDQFSVDAFEYMERFFQGSAFRASSKKSWD